MAWGQQPLGICSNNWTESSAGPTWNRWNPCEKVLNVDNVRNLVLKWHYATDGEGLSSPAVANGVVYGVTIQRQGLRAERTDWRQTMELPDRRRCCVLARRGEWGKLMSVPSTAAFMH